MKFWIDGIDLKLIEQAVEMGLLFGITTNPKILAQENSSVEKSLDKLLSIQDGPITLQVIGDNADEMIRQGQRFYYYSNRIVIKVPATKEGFMAIHRLSRHSIPTMATALFTPAQALMAAEVGATYVAPYLSRMKAIGIDPINALSSMVEIFKNQEYSTEILAASLSDVEQIVPLAEKGIHGVTLKPALFESLIDTINPTKEAVDEFNSFWLERKPPLSTVFI